MTTTKTCEGGNAVLHGEQDAVMKQKGKAV